MAHNDMLTVAHRITGKIESLPRSVVEGVYPDLFVEVSDKELADIQRAAELAMYGEYKTQLPVETPAEDEATTEEEAK